VINRQDSIVGVMEDTEIVVASDDDEDNNKLQRTFASDNLGKVHSSGGNASAVLNSNDDSKADLENFQRKNDMVKKIIQFHS
jgi:hypothetical protein